MRTKATFCLDERRVRAQSGLTMLEATVVVTLLTGMVLAIDSLLMGSVSTDRTVRRLTRVREATEVTLGALRDSLEVAVFLAQENDVGRRYLDSLDIDRAPPMLGGRLPIVDQAGIFHRERLGEKSTGNILLFAEHERTISFTASSGSLYRVPIYRMHLVYLANLPDPRRVSKPGFDLCRWVSEPMADAGRIEAIQDPDDQIEVIQRLLAGNGAEGRAGAGLSLAWRVAEDPALDTTFQRLTSIGTLAKVLPGPRSVRPDRDALVRRLSPQRLAVATNDAPDRFGVARFARKDLSGPGYPHGFEVQVIGSDSSRRILVSLSILEPGAGELDACWHQHVVAYASQGVAR
jgi:hypothetical protein